MEANKKVSSDFNFEFNGIKWHCYETYVQQNGKPAWFECERTNEDGVRIMRLFGPAELDAAGVNLEVEAVV